MLRVSQFLNLPRSLKVSRPPLGLFLLLMGLLVPLLIAACGGDDPTAVPQTAATNTPQPATATATQTVPDPTSAPDPTSTPDPVAPINTVGVSNQGSLGSHLVDGDGMTLYLFTNDERNVSNCSPACLAAWPPLLVDGDPVAGEGLNADRLTAIDREDGSKQVAYNGKPLYYFADDQTPADTLGQNRGNVWYVVSPDGGPIRTTAAVNAKANETVGTILTDPDGNSLYLFTRDERNVSNCSGGCALAWPPLLTIDDPAPGEGLAADRIGTTTRVDGSKQVTYNGWPLYYFAADEKPGDSLGQDVGGVWFVVTTDGGAVYTNAPVNAAPNGDLGTILLDAAGRSLYLYTRDERNVSNCTGGCALAWPPLITVEDPVPGEGLAADRIGTTTRADGSKQVTYNGWPLYYFAADEKPGDAIGQDRGGVWFVVTTDGGAVYTNAPVNATENGDMGMILTDAAGRSLYLYTRDEPNVSNCSGGCALAWPPLITIGDPAPGEGVSAARIGTTTRADGSKQVTFDGDPLYYYAADEKPGDTIGQDRGQVWYVINNTQPLAIVLGEQNDSGQTGTAVLAGRGSFTNVSLSLSAGALASELTHIHSGQCGASDLGGVVHALTSFEGGSGVSVTNVPASLGSLMTGAFAVNIHKAGESGVYTSCGNIPTEGDSLTIALGELNGSGQTGFVSLIARGLQTEVVVSATAGISALAHIHSGTCQTLGGVVHPLSDTSGSISSATVDATLDSLIAGDFAVNLHTAADASVYTSCGDI
ncbi:MAG: CHRD domain-containing protein [Chloroflexi bacterium]|nr:CHRD domain-containing protein [Chloroflexota bacterium]